MVTTCDTEIIDREESLLILGDVAENETEGSRVVFVHKKNISMMMPKYTDSNFIVDICYSNNHGNLLL